MSMEEVELRDLLTQTLETNGCLAKIRAQLRASVFLALDESTEISKQQPLVNNKIKSCLGTQEGRLVFSLVREFLEYFSLDYTLSVYDAETYFGSFYTCDSREKMIDSLGMGNIEGPILLHLLKISQRNSKPSTSSKASSQQDVSSDKKAAPTNADLNSTFVVECPKDAKDEQNSRLSSALLDNTSKELSLENLPNGYNDMTKEETLVGDPSLISEETSVVETESPTSITKHSDSKSSDNSKLKMKTLVLETSPLNKASSVSEILPSLYSKEFKDKSGTKDLDIHFCNELEYEDDFLTGSDTDGLKSNSSHTNDLPSGKPESKVGSHGEPKPLSSRSSTEEDTQSMTPDSTLKNDVDGKT